MKPTRSDKKTDEILKKAQESVRQSKRLLVVAEKALADNKLFFVKFRREIAAIRETMRKFKSK